MIIGKNLGFDLNKNRALCLQLNQYKEGNSPFDFPVEYGFDEPINWWNVIETKPQPNSLPLIALYLFAICQFVQIQHHVKEDFQIWVGLLINVVYN